MDCSTPDLPAPHYLSKFAQVHVHCISNAIQPSHPLMLSSSALSLAQHKGFSQWVSSSHLDQNTGASASASALPVNIQDWSPLRLTGLISLLFRNFLQHHSLKASILWNSVFFMELIELKTFSTKKEIINKKKRQPSKWWKIFANEATIKDYISKIYKQLMLLNIKKNI